MILSGTIRRRILVNYAVDPAVAQTWLPAGMRPKLHQGHAIAGICLLALDDIQPDAVPLPCGLSSENAAHRIAVEWGGQEGVYIFRRDTASLLNHWAGGRLFPGEHHAARIDATESGPHVTLDLHPDDAGFAVHIAGASGAAHPATSLFATREEASRFFEAGCDGYSVCVQGRQRLQGLRLEAFGWQVENFGVTSLRSDYFDHLPGARFDHALIMRGIRHRWHALADYAA